MFCSAFICGYCCSRSCIAACMSLALLRITSANCCQSLSSAWVILSWAWSCLICASTLAWMSLLGAGAPVADGAAEVDGAVVAGGAAAPGELADWAKASAGRVSMAAKATGAMREVMMDRSRSGLRGRLGGSVAVIDGGRRRVIGRRRIIGLATRGDRRPDRKAED